MITEQSAARSQNIQATTDEPRIEMKPTGSAPGYVDGGWWPRSTDPASEFPGLIVALRGHVGQVSRVTYNLDFWAPVHRKLTVDSRVVRCEGFRAMNTHTATAIGVNSQRMTVLVVPPDTPEDVAQAALRTAAGHDNTATVENILASTGVRSGRPTSPQPHQAEREQMRRYRANVGKTKAAMSTRTDHVPTNAVR
jgi:hypothetical protein